MNTKDTKILIIDDNEEILYALSVICEYKEWIPITATTVDDGIKKFKEKDIDIVLIDYHMPRINGIVGVKMLRKLSKIVPIIVLTVEEKQAIADEFMEVGANDFALKPIKAPDLIARINVHLQLVLASKKNSQAYKEYTKGINQATLSLVEDCMVDEKGFTTIAQISKKSGLAYQTVHRYLQHLILYGKVDVNQTYGKVGRPKQEYKWIE